MKIAYTFPFSSMKERDFEAGHQEGEPRNQGSKRQRPKRGKSSRKNRGSAKSNSNSCVAASAAYLVRGILPLLAAFAIKDQNIRVIVAAAISYFSMLVLGNVAAALRKASVARSCARVLVGGSIEIVVMIRRRKVLEIEKILGQFKHMKLMVSGQRVKIKFRSQNSRSRGLDISLAASHLVDFNLF
ncbi:hypothetical protein RJ640_020182 [Escallonia rubra]|uniref:Vacuolar iron transporter n=1 Tax=Escallonia rubra TaxID=112253 RepID=A0AA88UUK1_9ASTE|nr:hypothetical protein RJ640_020182 [Escallonia rubra]